MRLSILTTVCLTFLLTCLPVIGQELIGLPAPTPAGSDPVTASQDGTYVPAAAPAAPVAETPSYDPASYNQWDPKNPETLYPAPGPEPTPPLGPCDERTGGGYHCPKNWYVDQGVRIMYHPTARAQLFSQYYEYGFLNTSINEDIPVFQNAGKSGSLKMEPSAGYDITIGKYLGRDSDNRDQFIEFTYYGLNKWESRFDITSTQQITISDTTAGISTTSGNLFSLFGANGFTDDEALKRPVSGFNRADSQTLLYDSRWDSFELNLRIKPRRRADRLLMHKNAQWSRESHEGWFSSYLLGTRGVSLDEYFAFYSQGHMEATQTGVADPIGIDVSGRYTSRTRNDMFGLQTGLDCIHQKGPWRFGADMKAGIFINFADNHTRARSWGASTDGDPTTGDPWASENVNFQTLQRSRDVASIAELGFMTSYQIRRNMTASLSYDLAWITGVALAPEQYIPQANAPDRIDHNGALLMQSLRLGLELVW